MIFDPNTRHETPQKREIYARYELIITIVNFIAAVTFIIGSFMFLSPKWELTGTWFFIVGSFCFALSPLIRLVREWRMMKSGQVNQLAENYLAE